MFAHIHVIVGVAVFHHSLGNAGGIVLLVGQHAYLLSTLYQSSVQFLPGTPCERNNPHVVIEHHQLVSQHLKRVESRMDHNLCLWHQALDGVGKTEEQRVAADKCDNRKRSTPLFSHPSSLIHPPVLLYDSVYRYRDIYPSGPSWQQRSNNLMMTPAT